jgi:Flp pilus assembly pilin Flp
MDLLVAAINAVVVAVVGGIVAWLGKGRFDEVDRKIDRLEARLDGRIDGVQSSVDGQFDSLQSHLEGRFDTLQSHLEGRFDTLQSHLEGRFDTLQSSMDAMRSDLTHVALAVGVRPRAQND